MFSCLAFSPIVIDRLLSPDEEAAINRLPMWRVAINVIMENPIFGTGLNSYSEIMHQYDPKRLIGGFIFPVHNVYLFIAAEIGIPGAVFLLLFFVTIGNYLFKSLKKQQLNIMALSAGLLGGLIALFLHGLVDSSFKQDLQLWYVIMAFGGIAIAIVRLNPTRKMS